MAAGNLPKADVEITPQLARSLLRAQHPDLADLKIQELASGWDNVLYRLGADYTIRLPRRIEAADLARNEIRWLPRLAPSLPLPIPSPVRIGVPATDYPYPWSVLPWFEGEAVGTANLETPKDDAARLGEFLAALHRPAPTDAPVNPHRGNPLADRDELTRTRLRSLDRPDAESILSIWDDAIAASRWDGSPMWIHGDLHAFNILHHDGALSAVLDFGDISSGDPATDLMAGWYVFANSDHDVFRTSADSPVRPIDEDMWRRGRGWAVSHALAILVHSGDAPGLAAMAEKCMAAAISDFIG